MESKTLIAENPICMKVVLMHGKLLRNWKLERLQLSIALFSLSMTQSGKKLWWIAAANSVYVLGRVSPTHVTSHASHMKCKMLKVAYIQSFR